MYFYFRGTRKCGPVGSTDCVRAEFTRPWQTVRGLLRAGLSPFALSFALCAGALSTDALADDPPLNAVASAPKFGTNAAGATVLNSFTVTIPLDSSIRVGDEVRINWPVPVTDPNADPTKPPTTVRETKVKVGAGGVTEIKVPDEAEDLGTKVTITVKRRTNDNVAVESETKFTWEKRGVIFKETNVFVLNSPAPPGNGPQHWHIPNPANLPIEQIFPVPGTHTIVDSGFDLTYSLASGNTYNVNIAGDDSFISLADGTYIAFPDTTLFGTIDIAAGADSGVFDFFGIGATGSWMYDAANGETQLNATRFSRFDAPAISTVPEPSTLWLSLAVLAGWLAIRLQHNRSRIRVRQSNHN